MMTRALEDVRHEIEQFVRLLEIPVESGQYYSFESLAKTTLFFKSITDIQKVAHYPKYMIYDMLMVIYSLTKKSKREIYNTYRSLIENFIRYELNLDDTDVTGVLKMFRDFKKKYANSNTTEIIEYIESEYDVCCNYVHSNIKADVQLLECLNDIVQSQGMDTFNQEEMILEIVTFYNQIVTFCCYTNATNIGRAFYKKNQALKFLIGENNYQISRSDIE